MSRLLEEYGLLSDCERAALVDTEGSIDWLCLPRFDSPACFAALLGTKQNGYFKICPTGQFSSQRQYRRNTMILETDFTGPTGRVRLIDFFVMHAKYPLLKRQIIGLEGEVEMNCDFVLRFDYGSVVPWIRKTNYGLHAVAGPDEVHLQAPQPLTPHGELSSKLTFTVHSGQSYWFTMSWGPEKPTETKPDQESIEQLNQTADFWMRYAAKCTYHGRYKDCLIRSVLTLKALSYHPTGGIVAAPTTSLPETLGGERNWDYRFCWIRDSTFSMYALLTAGYQDEAKAWREWLMRALAGTPSQVNIMYGLAGERRLTEIELPWLEGYEGSKPVRIGNAAYKQLQLDVFGEALDTLYLALKSGLPVDENSWRIQECFIEFLLENWDKPDEGIWEVRGPRRHYVHSKVMSWVAVDRAIRSAELAALEAPLERWKELRRQIHEDICKKGFDPDLNSFTQSYGSKNIDASLLMILAVGFLPADDPRAIGTVAAVEKELFQDGFVLRYKTEELKDELHGREGSFLACSFWLADCWILMGRFVEAEKLFQRLISLANDLGLLSEEYDSKAGRLVGNFPQALSHIALINTAFNLSIHRGPAQDRSAQKIKRVQ